MTENMNSQTVVSVIMPVRNEERSIRACLDSILANDYPQQQLEILVIDGMSTDRTPEIVREYAGRYPFLRLLENPRRIIPAALNVGIHAAQGEIIVRMDGHTTYAPDFILQAVMALESSGAAMVGAVQKAAGNTPVTRAIAAAKNSRFGAGNAYYHYGTESRWVEDSVYLGVWYRRRWRGIGGFNEKWLINEDSELNQRLRDAGGKILLSLTSTVSTTFGVRCAPWLTSTSVTGCGGPRPPCSTRLHWVGGTWWRRLSC